MTSAVGLLRILLPSRPMAVYPPFKRAAKHQDHGGQRNARQDDDPFADPAGRADAGGQPDAGGGGQAVNLFAEAVVDDHAGAQKADAGDDALDDAADIAGVLVPIEGKNHGG